MTNRMLPITFLLAAVLPTLACDDALEEEEEALAIGLDETLGGDVAIDPYDRTLDGNEEERVDPLTGELVLAHVDAVVPGRGPLLRVIRTLHTQHFSPLGGTQNGRDLQSKPFGLDWHLHQGRLANLSARCPAANDRPVFETPDGVFIRLFRLADGSWRSNGRWRGACRADGTAFVVSSPEGLRYTLSYFASGADGTGVNYATRIDDADGNYLTITLGVRTKIAPLEIRASDGRRVTFQYGDVSDFGDFLRSVTIHDSATASRVVRYGYDDRTVINFDQGALDCGLGPVDCHCRYSRDAREYVLQTVTDAANRVRRYGYDLSDGDADYCEATVQRFEAIQTTNLEGGSTRYALTGSVANLRVTARALTPVVGPSGTWTYAYATSSSGAVTTTINGPDARTTLVHTGWSSGSAWKIGALERVEIRPPGSAATATPLEVRRYTFAAQKVAAGLALKVVQPGTTTVRADPDVNLPLLTRAEIDRAGETFTTRYEDHDGQGNATRVVELTPGGASRVTTRSFFISTAKDRKSVV